MPKPLCLVRSSPVSQIFSLKSSGSCEGAAVQANTYPRWDALLQGTSSVGRHPRPGQRPQTGRGECPTPTLQRQERPRGMSVGLGEESKGKRNEVTRRSPYKLQPADKSLTQTGMTPLRLPQGFFFKVFYQRRVAPVSVTSL